MRFIPVMMVVILLLSNYAYADNPGQFGIKMIPGKITEGTEGLIQVYSKSGETMDKLVATSYDTSIVQVIGTDSDNLHKVYTVKIKALKSGETKLALAAPGFSSQEFTVDVSKNSNIASKLLIKTTPSTFNTDGPKHGYFAIETTNDDGFPTAVSSDTQIAITVSDTNIVSLKNNQVVIKKDSYYTVGEFDVNQPGSAQISASTQSMQTVSSIIAVNNVNSQDTLQVYVYPAKINAYKASYVYAIVQLHDSSGTPILAKDDIPITVQVINSTGTGIVNTSGSSIYVQVNEKPVIKKGSYWTYVPVEITAGTNNVFNVAVSGKGNLVSPAAQFTSVMDSAVYDDKSAKIDILPILATGGKELVGISHLEDNAGNILLAKEKLNIHVDSSDPSTLSVDDVIFDHGSQAVPVFAQVGNVINPVTLNVVTATPQTITPTINSMNTAPLTLVAEPLIPKVLSHVAFPLSFYMTKGGVISLPTSGFDMQIAPTDVIQTAALSFPKGSSIHTTNATILQDGQQVFSLTSSTYLTTFTIDALSSDAKSITMDYPDTIVSNTTNAFSVELLDEQNLPVYPSHDVSVKIVSSNPAVMDFPDDIQIKKGTYYATFNADAKKSGSVEIAILVEQIPLSKFTISVVSFSPELSIASPDFSQTNIPFVATLTATYDQAPLVGLKVDWIFNGTTIQNMSSTTDSGGKAVAKFVSYDPGTAHIEATVSGGSYESQAVSKDVTINLPLAKETQLQNLTSQSFTIMGISPILVVIPAIAGGIGFLFFKKREMLESITEKISSIKEKITDLRQRD
ncbi:MAG: hypothetical protein ACYC6W_07315 [Nitrosotalea sp.]